MNATPVTRPGSLRRVHVAIRLLGICAVLVVGQEAGVVEAATFTVTTTSDGPGMCPGFVVGPLNYPCTLRAAIEAVNQQPAGAGPHTINFNIGYGVQTITPASPLPAITQPVVIDGGTQLSAGWLFRSTLLGGPIFVTVPCDSYKYPRQGHPCIVLSGAGVAGDGLTLAAGNSTVRELVINGFNGSGIRVASDNNLIANNYIGTDYNGAQAQPNTKHGVIVDGSNWKSAAKNLITANLIAGNSQNGILLTGPGAVNNQVVTNYIGTTKYGSAAIPNATAISAWRNCFNDEELGGVVINRGASSNVIGGTTTGNVISGNGLAYDPACNHPIGSGVVIDATNFTEQAFAARTYNQVLGNYIGTNARGTSAVGNAWHGVLIRNASNNLVGGTTSGSANVIGGNEYGIGISAPAGAAAVSNTVQGNYIGTNAANAVLGNTQDGVNLGELVNSTTAQANFVKYNQGRGIIITSSDFSNSFQSNTSLYNKIFDMEDDNSFTGGTCANTWSNNTFVTELTEYSQGIGCIH